MHIRLCLSSQQKTEKNACIKYKLHGGKVITFFPTNSRICEWKLSCWSESSQDQRNTTATGCRNVGMEPCHAKLLHFFHHQKFARFSTLFAGYIERELLKYRHVSQTWNDVCITSYSYFLQIIVAKL